MVLIVSTLFTENVCFVGTVNTDSTRRKTATPVLNMVDKIAEGGDKVFGNSPSLLVHSRAA